MLPKNKISHLHPFPPPLPQLEPNTHCILDGFPLDKYQAEAIDELVQPVDRVFLINAEPELCKARFRHEVNATTTLRAVLTPDRRKWHSSSARLQQGSPASGASAPSVAGLQQRQRASDSVSSYADSDMTLSIGAESPTREATNNAVRDAPEKQATPTAPTDISDMWLTAVEYDSHDEDSDAPPLERSMGHIKSLHLLRNVVKERKKQTRAERHPGYSFGPRHSPGGSNHRRLASEPSKRSARSSVTKHEEEHKFEEVRPRACVFVRPSPCVFVRRRCPAAAKRRCRR